MTKGTYLKVVDILKNIIAGSKFEGHVYCVGGCVRDLLLGRSIKDIDIVVDLPNGGIELAEWLKNGGYTKGSVVTYPHFGTAMFVLKDMPDVELESVQTRKEVYRDMESRNPETVFGSIEDDRGRRDLLTMPYIIMYQLESWMTLMMEKALLTLITTYLRLAGSLT